MEQKRFAAPKVHTVDTLPVYAGVDAADYYVAPNGSDENDGSRERPFRTIGRARDAVRAMDKTGKTEIIVGIFPGDYRTTGLVFTAEDSGTAECPVRYCRCGAGDAVLNGGVTLHPADFRPVTDEAMLSRLNPDAREKVRCLELGAYGIAKADYGKLYTIGKFNTADKYDGDWLGDIYSEVFFNDSRMVLARYPNVGEDYLYTEEVVFTGEGLEKNGNLTADPDWHNKRNHPSDIYRVSETLARRVASWKTLEDVWLFGWWKCDWADAASPIGSFDAAERTLSPKFVSWFGTKTGAPYYFYNVFEELDAPGEFYLDRENAMLYIYPAGDMDTAKIDMSLSTDSVVTIDGASHLSFEGLVVCNTRGDAVTVRGNDNQIAHCTIKNVAGNGICANGYRNVFFYNEITRTGRGGIVLDGGDAETLTPAENRAENNLIHHWSEIYQTYQPAVYLCGVGNICAHNEMHHSPHEGISYIGNNHLIEYNILHDICLLTHDGAAIYSGRSWSWYGNVVRYNCIYDLGSTVKNGDELVTYTPDGIYFDDNLAGQTTYGNLIVNAPKFGFLLGSGRDLNVYNNIVIGSRNGIHYDCRTRDGSLRGGWFNHHFRDKKDGMYEDFLRSPWQTEAWQKAYPQMAKFSLDYDNPDDPNLPFNPTDSVVTKNLLVCCGGEDGKYIHEDVYRFSPGVKENWAAAEEEMQAFFTDPAHGDYTLLETAKLPGFEPLPLEKMGIEE